MLTTLLSLLPRRGAGARVRPDRVAQLTTFHEADAWIGRVAVDSTGRKVGRITRMWIDDYSGLPAWATVATGRPGGHEGIAPLSRLAATGGRQQLACRREQVMSAPQVDDDGHFGLDDEWRLINHYNIDSTPDPRSRTPQV